VTPILPAGLPVRLEGVSNWETTIADLATGFGTLVLAVATFASVRSANRSARVAQESLLANMRPVLMNSRLQDPAQKIMFGDDRWAAVPGGGAAIDHCDTVIYLLLSVRNAGTGMGIIHGWRVRVRDPANPAERPPLNEFTPQTRDLYVSPGDLGFWQGALRDPDTEVFQQVSKAIDAGDTLNIDLLYGDFEGGQRVITRFTVALSPYLPHPQDGDPPDPPGDPVPPPGAHSVRWIASVVRHWNVDNPDPR
jgi:hypothetical protein